MTCEGQHYMCVWVCTDLCRCFLTFVQVTGLDGNYRTTCHTVMEVLREHKDSVMAVLEAFVYDPLLNWRLMDSKLQIRGIGSLSSKPAYAI